MLWPLIIVGLRRTHSLCTAKNHNNFITDLGTIILAEREQVGSLRAPPLLSMSNTTAQYYWHNERHQHF